MTDQKVADHEHPKLSKCLKLSKDFTLSDDL